MADSEGGNVVPLTREIVLHLDPDDTPQTFQEAADRVLAEQRAILIERQKKYGPRNILRLGLLGVLRRAAEDKVERIQRVYERDDLRERCLDAGVPDEIVDAYLPALTADYPDESIEDAHHDAANYLGVISIMLRRGWWGLPLAEEGEDDG